MNGAPNALLRSLEVTRLSHLWGRLCLPTFTLEVSILVGTRPDSDEPRLFLDTLNLVFRDTDKLGGGRTTPSACLRGTDRPPVEYDRKGGAISAGFDILLDLPASRRERRKQADQKGDTPGATATATQGRLDGRFRRRLRPTPYGFETLDLELSIDVPAPLAEELRIEHVIELAAEIPVMWLPLGLRRELCVQPVFIAADGDTPPTGSDFYPLLARANEIWAKCCIQFRAKCPIYVDEQEYRISTPDEASDFKDEVDVDDAVEIFVVERLDPEDTWGGGATWGSGTAGAKIVTGDNQLPVNQNHLAHELGHALGLGHPGEVDSLTDGCAGSVMEPSGFYADNPEYQCRHNCQSASNPLLTIVPWELCIRFDRFVGRGEEELF